MIDYIFFSLMNFFTGIQYSYTLFLYILIISIFAIIIKLIQRKSLQLEFLIPLCIFIILQIIMHLQPPGSTEANDTILRNYLYILVNPITLILFSGVSTWYFFKTFQSKFKHITAFLVLICCFVANAVVYDHVFFYIRDNVITKFYPYSRQLSPTRIKQGLDSCVPQAVKDYNGYVKMYQRNLAENPKYFKEQWDADSSIVSPEHLDKLYNDPKYFEPYLRLCYQDQPIGTDFVNPFLGTDEI